MNHLEMFEKIVIQQRARIEKIKEDRTPLDYGSMGKIVIGVIGGDGIGPFITEQARNALEQILSKEIESGKVEFRLHRRLHYRSVRQPEKRSPMMCWRK